MVRLTEWIWKSIPKTRWCITKWAICNFQGRDGWGARNSDNRWGAGTASRLKRDEVVKIARLSSCKNTRVWSTEWRMVISPMTILSFESHYRYVLRGNMFLSHVSRVLRITGSHSAAWTCDDTLDTETFHDWDASLQIVHSKSFIMWLRSIIYTVVDDLEELLTVIPNCTLSDYNIAITYLWH